MLAMAVGSTVWLPPVEGKLPPQGIAPHPDDAEFAAVCPTRARWELLCVAIGTYLRERTGLPVDFQIQLTSIANERYGGKMRNPLGMGRIFAGGGDGTPDWERSSPEPA